MSNTRKKIAVLFGGRSPEHDVSIVTGLQVLSAIDPDIYDSFPVYVTGSGDWLIGESLSKRSAFIPSPSEIGELTSVSLRSETGRPQFVERTAPFFRRSRPTEFDFAIPAFHGLFGEDGRIQGLLESFGVPYSGMRPLASAVYMDKIATKRLLSGAGIGQLPYWRIDRPAQGLLIPAGELERRFSDVRFPCCVKPSHLGSSIGVARVQDFQELSDVLPAIFRYDSTAILEPFVNNLVEYNVSVCRIDGEVRTSAIERPKFGSELLDFKAKYLAGQNKGKGVKGAPSEGMLSLTREINPPLPQPLENTIRHWAVEAFQLLDGAGAPRIDFLSDGATGEIWLNEINPCPGSFAYYLWEAAEKPLVFSRLIEILVGEGFVLHQALRLPTDPTPEEARLFKRRS